MRRQILAAVLCAATALSFSLPSYAGERLDNIVKTKTIRVGTPGDYRPFAMKEVEGFKGFDIDVIEKMAAVYGWKVEVVHSSWKALGDDLKAGKFDVAVGGITANPARILYADFLPGYAPFGKVALINVKNKGRFKTVDDLNQPDVHVIKNPGGTNEIFVRDHLKRAKVTNHDVNFEIPGLIAAGKGDVMITDTIEAVLYAKKDKNLAVAFLEKPLTPISYKAFMLPVDDADYTRVMKFLWNQLEERGELQELKKKWLD